MIVMIIIFLFLCYCFFFFFFSPAMNELWTVLLASSCMPCVIISFLQWAVLMATVDSHVYAMLLLFFCFVSFCFVCSKFYVDSTATSLLRPCHEYHSFSAVVSLLTALLTLLYMSCVTILSVQWPHSVLTVLPPSSPMSCASFLLSNCLVADGTVDCFVPVISIIPSLQRSPCWRHCWLSYTCLVSPLFLFNGLTQRWWFCWLRRLRCHVYYSFSAIVLLLMALSTASSQSWVSFLLSRVHVVNIIASYTRLCHGYHSFSAVGHVMSIIPSQLRPCHEYHSFSASSMSRVSFLLSVVHVMGIIPSQRRPCYEYNPFSVSSMSWVSSLLNLVSVLSTILFVQ